MISNKAVDAQVDEFIKTINTLVESGGTLSPYSCSQLRKAMETIIGTSQELVIQRMAKHLIGLTNENRKDQK